MIFIVVAAAVLFAQHPLVPLDVLVRPWRFPAHIYLICLGFSVLTAAGIVALFSAIGLNRLGLAICGAVAIVFSTPARDLLLGVQGRKLIGEEE